MIDKLRGWRGPMSMGRCCGMKKRSHFERAALRLFAEIMAMRNPPRFRWRTAMRARDKLSGHHRI